MKSLIYIILIAAILFSGGCITQFIPETKENEEMLVVEGLITDQPGINTIKLSRSLPLNFKSSANPFSGCKVSISDDLGNFYSLTETIGGTYVTDSAEFQGVVGRKYQLMIRTDNLYSENFTYESIPMEMKPVPPIDSIYYEKRLMKEQPELGPLKEGCQIYLDTHDDDGNCKYFRWNFTETWEFQLPFATANNTCWITNRSNTIQIKNTTVLSEDRISKYPIYFISSESDRLAVKYSMMVNQFSMNEEEYEYWAKLQNISDEVGSLYDITPSTIPGNIICIEDPGATVLGYFSVSSVTSQRVFIEDRFSGLADLYTECPSDTVTNLKAVTDLNQKVWVIQESSYTLPPYWVLTIKKGCADCTVRGTKIKPDFWNETKKN